MVNAAFPPAQVPLVDSNGIINPEWLKGFTALLNRTGGTASDFIAENLHVATTGIVVSTDPTTGAAITRSIASGTGLSVSNGSGISGNPTVSLAATAVSAGSYGDATHVGAFTVDAQGRLTSASSSAISFPADAVSSVFGRSGAVVAATNDYSFSQISGSVAASQLPNPSSTTLGGVRSAAAVSNQWINSISTSGIPALSQPAFSNISGTVAASQLPNPSSSTLGGVQSLAAVSTKFLTSISTSGVPVAAQPNFTDLAGTAAAAQLPLGSSSAFGALKVDGSTITASAGIISAVSAAPTAVGFMANRNGTNQVIGVSTTAKIQFNNVVRNDGSYYDGATNYRFTPPAGVYVVSLSTLANPGTSGATEQALIYKNGSLYASGPSLNATSMSSAWASTVNTIIYMNGTDYLEAYITTPAGTTDLRGDTDRTFFTAYRVGV